MFKCKILPWLLCCMIKHDFIKNLSWCLIEPECSAISFGYILCPCIFIEYFHNVLAYTQDFTI